MSRMRVAVIGASGQLGADVCSALAEAGDEPLRLTHNEIEISDQAAVESVLTSFAPDFIVNTAAMHHVEKCELDPVRAHAVNALGARNLAAYSSRTSTPLMHVSTDYAFGGDKGAPYEETDLPCPVNVYGNTKVAGEMYIQATTSKHFIVRSSGLYGHSPCRAKGHNFVELMLRLAKERDELRVVDSEVLSPTSTRQLAVQMVALAHTDHYGLYHATARGHCSWYEFAREIFKLTGTRVKLSVASPGEFPAKVPRPAYSVLRNKRLDALDLNRMAPWQEGLRQYLGSRQAASAIRGHA